VPFNKCDRQLKQPDGSPRAERHPSDDDAAPVFPPRWLPSALGEDGLATQLDLPGHRLAAVTGDARPQVPEIGRDVERVQEDLDFDAAIDEEVGDDLLGLIFTACHPVLSKEARVALALRVLGGLTTEEIARGFLVPVSTIAQRVVRAKRTLAEAHVRFEDRADRVARLTSVLEVIYLIFNEGYSATAGKDWIRAQLCDEALRLGRILAELLLTEPEVHGLVALMEIQASRLGARVGPDGEPIFLLDQDRTRWDRLLIRRGLAALERAERLGGVCRSRKTIGGPDQRG
jgi:predicted RNA polymerase sigma factor